MAGYFNSLFARVQRPGGQAASATLRAAVERVIDGVDPRLRLVRRYQHTLRRPVDLAIQYLAESVETLPPAIPFDRYHVTMDPRLRALFLGPDHLLETLSSSPDVRDYLQQAAGPPPPELFVALRAERTERTNFGIALEADRLLWDVPRTTVSFHNHSITFPAAAESETRRQIQQRAFDDLIEIVRFRLASARARRLLLEYQQRRLLQRQAQASGTGELIWNDQGITPPVAWLDGSDERKLREIMDELKRLRGDLATLFEQLALVAGMLVEVREHLRIHRVTMTLDLMNVKVPRDSPTPADTMIFNEMLIGADRCLISEMIRFPSRQLLPAAFTSTACGISNTGLM